MIRLRSAASAISKAGLSAAALFMLSAPLAADETDTFTDDDSALQVRFYDNSPYAQVSRIRSVTFLTLKNSGKSRWFLGVNSNGIFGLHYRPSAQYRRDTRKDSVRLHFLESQLTFETK